MILIVEDNLVISEGLRNIVKEIDPNADVVTTGYALKALQYANATLIRLFILDIRLKDYSGIELGKQIRSMEQYLLTPIVFITGNITAELESYRETQCYRFITKPFVQSDVRAILKPLIMRESMYTPIASKLQLTQKGYALSLNQDDILYLESNNRKIILVTRHEKITLSTYTLQGLKTELNADFVQCHKGFVINIKWISKIDRAQNLVYLLGRTEVVPLGEKYRDALVGV